MRVCLLALCVILSDASSFIAKRITAVKKNEPSSIEFDHDELVFRPLHASENSAFGPYVRRGSKSKATLEGSSKGIPTVSSNDSATLSSSIDSGLKEMRLGDI